MGFKAKIPFTFLLSALLSTAISSTPINDEPQFYNGLKHFSKNIFEEIFHANNGENIIFSPFSIQTCMTMARMGSKGSTAKRMDEVLGFSNLSEDRIGDNYYNLLAKYEKSADLKLANKFYVMTGLQLKENYNDLLNQKFFSSVENLDFSESDKATDVVNNWVASKTDNTITHLVDSLSPDAVLVMLSAIYFQGNWARPFPEDFTRERKFFVDDKKRVDVTMMNRIGYTEFASFQNLEAAAVRLPYKDSDLSMMIILPNARNGLSAMLDKLKNVSLKSLVGQLKDRDVDMQIPKFKAELTINLKDILKKMGLSVIFENPDFSGMLAAPKPLTISQAIHKAIIEVNEVGTKASGATLMEAVPFSVPQRFVADHPFYYVIMNSDTVPLFEGTFVGP
ncbi:serine protease inhibitor 42Dd-like [Haematobia irritans]|uniref:serine protease inhibitor 42Dd-like n=1 Tax=Haematobia irritans TaxID=7368 RepID=UPI003F50B5CD